MLILSILFIWLSITVILQRDMAILYNRISLNSLFYCGLISYAATIILNQFMIWGLSKNLTPKHTSLICILTFVILQIFTWLVMYENTVTSIVEFDYVEFFRYCPENFNILLKSLETTVKVKADSFLTFGLTHVKFLLAMLFNLLFSFIFAKNFVEKHIYFFSKDGFRNLNLYSFGIIIFIIIILFLPRIILRNFMTIFFFGKISYFSVVLPVFWLLPFISYIINLLVKLITKQKIKKEDFSFFNKNVVNSINIFSLCLILLFIYIGLYHSRYFIEIILGYLPSFSSSIIQHIVPPSQKLANAFSSDKVYAGRSNYSVNLKGGTVSLTQLYLQEDSHLRRSICYNSIFGNSAKDIINNPRSCIKQWDKYKDFELKYNTFSFIHAPGLYTGASIVAELPDKTNVLLVCMQDETRKDIGKGSWPDFYIKDKGATLNVITQLKNMGMKFKDFDLESLDGAMYIAAPGIISENKSPSSVFKDNTTSYKFDDGNYTQLTKLGIKLDPYVEPNWEKIFNNRYVSDRLQSWDIVKNIMGQPKDNSSELVFHSTKLGTGRFYDQNGQGHMCLTNQPSSRLPYCLSSIDSKYIDLAILDLNKKMGILIPSDKLKNLDIHTQIVGHRQQIYTIPTFTRYMDILPHSKARSVPLPNIPFISYTWNKDDPRTSKLLIKALKHVVSALDFYFFTDTDDNLLNNQTRAENLELWSNLKISMIDSILEDTYNLQKYLESTPFTKETQIGKFTLFNSDTKGTNFIALVTSSVNNKPLYEGLQFKLETNKLFVPTCVNPELRYELYKFLNDSLGTLKYGNCDHKTSVNILLWDNFCVEVGITKLGCRTYCENYDSSQDFYLDRMLWRDDEDNYHNSFNLLDLKDQKVFLKYFNSYIKPSSGQLKDAKTKFETKVRS
jgi:hypothetical protein